MKEVDLFKEELKKNIEEYADLEDLLFLFENDVLNFEKYLDQRIQEINEELSTNKITNYNKKKLEILTQIKVKFLNIKFELFRNFVFSTEINQDTVYMPEFIKSLLNTKRWDEFLKVRRKDRKIFNALWYIARDKYKLLRTLLSVYDIVDNILTGSEDLPANQKSIIKSLVTKILALDSSFCPSDKIKKVLSNRNLIVPSKVYLPYFISLLQQASTREEFINLWRRKRRVFHTVLRTKPD